MGTGEVDEAKQKEEKTHLKFDDVTWRSQALFKELCCKNIDLHTFCVPPDVWIMPLCSLNTPLTEDDHHALVKVCREAINDKAVCFLRLLHFFA